MAESFSKRTLFRPLPTLVLVGLSIVVAASCVADNDEPLASSDPAAATPAAQVPPIITASASNAPSARSLRQAFPNHAERVLGRTQTQRFVSADRGFARGSNGSLAMHLDVHLPLDAREAVRLTAPGGYEIRVRQIGVEGEGVMTDHAVTYRRATGTSFWTVTSGGAEEWLHLQAGAVTSDLDIAAEWEIEGARPTLVDGSVALMDEAGVARAWVTAPEAYGAEGRPVDLRLSVEGNRIELFADARGEEVLLDPGWLAVAPTAVGRYGPSVTTLPNGKILLAAGYTGTDLPTAAQLYDPATNMWSAAGTLNRGRVAQRDVLLTTGRVLIAGGNAVGGFTATAERYDPVANTWSSAGSMTGVRGNHAMHVLNSGTVLVAGGYDGGNMLATAQLYDPVANSWSAAASMSVARGFAMSARLTDGRVLVAGGFSGTGGGPIINSNGEIYNPATDTWTPTSGMVVPRYSGTIGVFPDGRVLVVGGYTFGGALPNAEIYDPVANTWTATEDRTQATGRLVSALMGTGRLLVVGGDDNSSAAYSDADAYDPATNLWTPVGNTNSPRTDPGIAVMGMGDVLVVNGSPTVAFTSATNTVDRYSDQSQAAGTTCQLGIQCASGLCVDGVCCTVAACTALDQCHNVGTCQPGTGVCSNPNKTDGTMCNDNSVCTQSDTCQAGVCTGANPVVCTALDQCHDPGTCDPVTGCSNPNKPDGTTCIDGNACTQTDTCQAGVCTGANPVVCTALDQCHVAGTCNPATGVCSDPNKPNGTVCNDSNACTQTDTCQTGVCTGSNPVICTASDQCHVAGTCDTATGVCSNPEKPDGSTCSDGNACTQTDTCQTGACVGANPVVCTQSDQCHNVGTCNPATGVCSNPNKPNGTPCNDVNVCTQVDTCQAGNCVGGNPIICTALDQCHDVGTCHHSTGICSNPPKANGAACNDGNACTQTDTCLAGACKGGNPVVCMPSDQCHVAGTCNTMTGTCSNPVKPDGATCSDNNGCTQTDTCMAGVCKGANPVVCVPSDSCHNAGACNPATGICTNPVKADGSSCTDSNKCTQKDTCLAGACMGSNPVTCAALDQCHDVGTCDPATGTCSEPPKADGVACDDKDSCTQTDTCQAGTCTGEKPVTCEAQDECHEVGKCDSTSGMCDNPAKPDGTPCGEEVFCIAGVCMPDGTGGAGGVGGTGGGGSGGAAGSSSSSGAGGFISSEEGDCDCHVVGTNNDRRSAGLAGLALAAMALIRRRRTARG